MIANVTVPATGPSPSTTEAITRGTVEVGRVFGGGGTDGLILYALILSCFLMFLALIAVLILAFRAINRRDTMFASQSSEFADASRETAKALTALATATATKESSDIAYRTTFTATLARVEGVLARLDQA